TDIKKGLGEFTPKPERQASFSALKATLKSAGYVLDGAEIRVAGTLSKEGDVWTVTVAVSGQKFVLDGPNVEKVVAGTEVGSPIELTGGWKTVGHGAGAREVITPAEKTLAYHTRMSSDSYFARFVPAKFVAVEDSRGATTAATSAEPAKPLAPIRVTSP